MALQPQKPGARGAGPSDARAREDAERQDRHRTEELADACGRLEEELEKLKARYELYLLGIERREPAREREEMRRRVARLKGEFTRNTGLRFRLETLHARFLSYDRMWTRSAREKEEGTYRRDLLRARRHGPAAQPRAEQRPGAGAAADRAEPTRAAAPEGLDTALPASALPLVPPRAGPTEAPAAAVPPPAPSGPTPEQLRALYDSYVDARRRCNEDVSRLSYDALARTVAKQVPELAKRYGARAVDFKVLIKDGRAVLTAVPRT